MFVCLFVGCLTAHQHKKAISATNTITNFKINEYIQNTNNTLRLYYKYNGETNKGSK
jgi:hypothetical protein